MSVRPCPLACTAAVVAPRRLARVAECLVVVVVVVTVVVVAAAVVVEQS